MSRIGFLREIALSDVPRASGDEPSGELGK